MRGCVRVRRVVSTFAGSVLILGICGLFAATARGADPLAAGAVDSSLSYEMVPAGAALPEGGWLATNPAQGLRFAFLDQGARIEPSGGADWQLDVSLAGAGREGEVQPVAPMRLAALANRIEYASGSGFKAWFANEPRGLVAAFELNERPDEDSPRVFEWRVAGAAAPRLDDSLGAVEFRKGDGSPLVLLGALSAWDAEGREVPARLEIAEGGVVRIVVERVDASYPVTIECLFTSFPKRKGAPRSDSGGGAAMEAVSATLAAPANDTCLQAEVIPAAGPFPYLTAIADIGDATTTDDPVARPACAAAAYAVSRSVWYKFTPVATGTYTFSTCADVPTGTSVFDTVLAVYSSSTGLCTGTFTQQACDDDSCAFEDYQSVASQQLAAGTTYYIGVWNLGAAPAVGSSSVQLRVSASFAQPPANDNCAQAETIPPAGPFPHLTSVAADISNATTAGDPAAPTCLPTGYGTFGSIWYAFTPAATGIYSISSCAGDGGGTGTTVVDTILAVYTATGVCSGFTEIPTAGLSDGCDDDSCVVGTFQAVVTTELQASTTYYIVAAKVGLTAPGAGETAVQLRVNRLPAPANDRCAAAVQLALDTPVSGSNEQAVDDYQTAANTTCYSGVGQITSSAAGRDVAYTFTSAANGLYSFKVTGFATSKNLVVHVASNCPATAPATIDCLKAANRNSSVSSEEVDCVSIPQGTTVYVYVDETTVTTGSPFVIEVNRCTREAEPNGTPAEASSFACGIEGAISPAGEADFFSVGTPFNGARIFSLVDGVAGSSSDFDLRVTTADETLEYDDLNADVPFGSLSGTTTGTPLPGVATYLRVSMFGAAAVSEPYRVYTMVKPPASSAAPETEPNDSTAQATQSPTVYVSGSLPRGTNPNAPSPDVDLFRIQASAGNLIFVGLDGDPLRDNTPINPALALLDAAGVVLVAVNDGSATSSTTVGVGGLTRTTPFSPGEALVWRARSTGTYYARVTIGTTSGTSIGAGDYLLAWALNCAPDNDDSDADGIANSQDCAQTNGTVWQIPGEVFSVRFAADKATLTWTAASGGIATIYAVLRGAFASLPVGPGGADETCSNPGTATSLQTPGEPTLGQGYWYLVRGSNVCGIGTYGFQGNRGTPGTQRLSATCP